MFDFLFQNKKGDLVSYTDSITVNIKKLEVAKMAIEKAVGMIAHAIAKSEFIVNRKGKREKDHIYWLLNIRPNPNETATDFWIEAIRRLLLDEECVICYVGNHLYIADSFTENNSVMVPETYSNVTIISNDNTIKLQRGFTSNEIIHLRSRNKKIIGFLEKVLNIYNSTISAMCAAKKTSSIPRYTLDVEGSMPVIHTKDKEGKPKVVTIDQYKSDIKKLLESDEIEVLTNSSGLKVSQLQAQANVSSEDIVKLANEIMVECAFAFDIPKAVFLGEITEKAVYHLDREQIEKEAMYDGFYAVITNLEGDISEIIRINRQRWEIEENFRIMKTEFEARPIYVRREDRIKAHFMTCYISLLLYRLLEKELGNIYTADQILETLRSMQMTLLNTASGYIPSYTRTELTDALHKTFDFRTDYEFITKTDMRTLIKDTKQIKSKLK